MKSKRSGVNARVWFYGQSFHGHTSGPTKRGTTMITRKEYAVCRYSNASEVTRVMLTDEEFATYLENAQQPEGLIALCDVPGIKTRSNETVYLESTGNAKND